MNSNINPLHTAIRNGDYETFGSILDSGDCNVDQIENDWGTPLYEAIVNNRTDFVQELLNRGANISIKKYKLSYMHIAVLNSANNDIIDLLLERDSGLLESRFEKNWNTPLICAFIRRNYSAVIHLLKRGASLYEKNCHGVCAMNMIHYFKNKEDEILNYA